MDKVENKDTVMVHYKGTLDDGSVFDSTYDGEPLVFKLGSGQILPAFEEALLGMEAFEKKSFKIPAKEAYGEYHEGLEQVIPKENFPEDIEIKIGEILLIGEDEENAIEFMITKLEGDSITLDPNHPLAGKDLNFDIEIVAVKKPE